MSYSNDLRRFLLAHLHMGAISRKTNPRAVKDALNVLPEQLNLSYDQTLDRIEQYGEEEKFLAYRIFSWLSYSLRPLSLLELQHALAVAPGASEIDIDSLEDEETIASVCAGLIVISKEPNSVVTLVRT
jgi:hypothetical protein